MPALTGPRKATNRLNDAAVINLLKVPMKAATRIWAGAMVMNDAGFAAPAATAVGKRALGVAVNTVDNLAGAAGAQVVEVRRGTFTFNNSAAGDLIAQANLGALCYVVDDNTVALTSGTGTRSIAGIVVGFEGTQVLVEILGWTG